jgi:hypothetical protein
MNNFYCILFSVFAVLASKVSSAGSFNKETTSGPAAVQPGRSKGQFISSITGLDALKVVRIILQRTISGILMLFRTIQRSRL